MVASVPQLEAYVQETCGVVYGDGLPFVAGARSARAVPAILRSWVQQLRTCTQLQQFHDVVLQQVARRPGARLPRGASDAQVVAAVREAVAAQTRLDSSSDGGAVVSSEQAAAMAAIVAHLQLLFEVPTLAGAIPRLSRLHSSLSEAATFTRSLRQVLGLDASTPPHVVLDRVRALAGQSGAEPA